MASGPSERVWAPLVVATSVIALWVGAWISGVYFFPTWEARGQFGDLFGSVNALFSGLAFAGLIYAILLQRQELGLQRTELKLQREEMAASRAELAAQVEAQTALFHATVCQIRVAAQQARVEAMKMEAESRTPGHRDEWVRRIHEIAGYIEAIADDVHKTASRKSPSDTGKV